MINGKIDILRFKNYKANVGRGSAQFSWEKNNLQFAQFNNFCNMRLIEISGLILFAFVLLNFLTYWALVHHWAKEDYMNYKSRL